MSLVVAQMTESGIYIVSDSKISKHIVSESRLTKELEHGNPFLNGISKIFLLDHDRCIAFAGDIGRATETLMHLRPQDSTQGVIDSLQDASRQGGIEDGVSFLFGCVKPERRLIIIRNGSALVNSEGWIGDDAAYSLYRSFFEGQRDSTQIYDVSLGALRLPEQVPEQDSKLYGSMYLCMAAAIDSGESKSIGGFVVPLLSEQNHFCFGSYGAIFRNPIDPDLEQIGNDWKPLQLGTSGAFSLTFGQIGSGFAVHIVQCSMGIVYEARDTLILERNLTKNVDEIDFVKMLESSYGPWRGPLVAHEPNHFWQKAEKLGAQGLFSDAAGLFSEGIRRSSLAWKHKSHSLHIYYDSLKRCLDSEGSVEVPQESVRALKHAFLARGKCRYHLKQYQEALQDFNDALLLDSNFSECLECKEGVLKILNTGA